MTALPYLTPGVRSFKDRSTMLTAVGICLIVGGCLAGCGTIAMPLALVLPRPRTPTGAAPGPNWTQMVPGLVMYALAAILLITLGVGSLRKRRWVRPIILVVAWIGLIIGVMSAVFLGVMFPDMVRNMRATMPAATAAAPGPPVQMMITIMVVVAGFIGLLYIIIPALLIFLFKSPDVQATCEFYDPVPRWTDFVPLSVLGLCGLLLLMALSPLMMLPQGLMPLFGTFIFGAPARVGLLLTTIVCLLSAVWVYRLRMIGWWLALAIFALAPLSGVITFLRADPAEAYRRSGLSEEQIKMLGGMIRMMGPLGAAWGLVFGIGAIIYAIRIRKYFSAASPSAPPGIENQQP
jgi:hypothetical protein